MCFLGWTYCCCLLFVCLFHYLFHHDRLNSMHVVFKQDVKMGLPLVRGSHQHHHRHHPHLRAHHGERMVEVDPLGDHDQNQPSPENQQEEIQTTTRRRRRGTERRRRRRRFRLFHQCMFFKEEKEKCQELKFLFEINVCE